MKYYKYYFFIVDQIISTLFQRISFPGTQFCESLLLPTERSLKNSLEAALLNANRRTHLDEEDQVDACCRSLRKCDAYKRITSNRTIDSFWKFQSCECIHLFRICLDNMNTSLSNQVAFWHSINTTNCYTNDHPIVQCIKWESYPESKTPFLRFVSQAEREKFYNRCSKYELDGNRPKQLQIRDLPFNQHQTNMSQQTFNLQKSEFVPDNW